MIKEYYLFDEIVVDNFAGGGGASCGLEAAIGRAVDIAINHDHTAIRMHRVNHPYTDHYCEDVYTVNPRVVCAGRPVGLAWFSPDCTHHSKARGGKPVKKEIRGLAWVAMKWAGTVRPRVIVLENVEEFQKWGPLLPNNKPDPKKISRTFNSFVNALRYLKYDVEWKELSACDYGAPTTRKRLFLIARCDGKPIVWPKPTHGDPNSLEVQTGRLKPWKTAATVIDFNRPCASIFERKKALAENTLTRIARGIQRFVIDNPDPFIVQVNYSGAKHHYCRPIHAPLSTITSKNGYALVTPYLAPKNNDTLVAAFLTKYHGMRSDTEVRGQKINNPILTIDTANRFALVTSHIIKMKGTNLGHKTDLPLQTITAGGNHFGEVRAFLMKYYGTSVGQSLNDPLHTITTKDTFGLVTVYGQDYKIMDIGMRMLEPYELFRAQGFRSDYIIDRDCFGKRFTKEQQVAKCGNSVSPVIPAHIAWANVPELCKGKMSEVV